ncbi:MAG: tyrosine recombinase XerC [Gammaproteobacteria bacterium]|nr:tyrosine recombinase XerC [Gammaproteobacteria bacterium]NNF60188.1 tyrosine recombinase XerC [Gammaproteobacteria bacterium]NNM21601.1 tyrosine recombinase XerC [Gammaproteobacteria bacterium]
MDAAQDRWLEQFTGHLTNERRLSAHTVSNYRRDILALARYCEREGVSAWADVDALHVRRFAAAEHRNGLSPRSIQRRLSAIRTFYDYLLREGEIRNNPATDVSAPQAKKRLPKTMDADSMAALLDFGGDEPLAVRDRAIMEMLYSCGLRLAELIGLDLAAVDLDDRTVRVTGKGDKTRVLPVGRTALEALRAWLLLRVQLARDEETAVFVSKRGTRMSPRSVQSRVAYWAKRQGVDVNVYPHLFRHSFATHVLESSGDLRGVQELLGHANISTTQVYTHLDFQHLANTYDKAHPRARRKKRSR